MRVSKGIQKGLNAVGFVAEDSKYSYDVENKRYVEFKASVRLKNYSNLKRECYIDCYLGKYGKEYFGRERFIGYQSNTTMPKLIQLQPKSEVVVEVDLMGNLSENVRVENFGGGGGSVQSIVVYNNKEQLRLDGENLFGRTVKFEEK